MAVFQLTTPQATTLVLGGSDVPIAEMTGEIGEIFEVNATDTTTVSIPAGDQ